MCMCVGTMNGGKKCVAKKCFFLLSKFIVYIMCIDKNNNKRLSTHSNIFDLYFTSTQFILSFFSLLSPQSRLPHHIEVWKSYANYYLFEKYIHCWFIFSCSRAPGPAHCRLECVYVLNSSCRKTDFLILLNMNECVCVCVCIRETVPKSHLTTVSDY